MWVILAVACSTGDPEAIATRNAIQAFRQGNDALESDPEQALAAFRDAQAHRPGAPLLRAWEGMALARTGELQAAIAVMDELIAADPRFAEARYNRASWLARSGQPTAAAEELKQAMRLGAARPREAMRDPDFAPHLRHPAFGFLPSEMLEVSLEAPTETVFWGSEIDVRFRVVGTGGEPVRIVPDQTSGPLVSVAVVENDRSSPDGRVGDLRYTFRVAGAGEVVLGPFTVQAGPWSTRVDGVRFTAEAPEGKVASGGQPRFVTPSELRGTWDCDQRPCGQTSSPAVRRRGRQVEVLAAPGARIIGGGPSVRYEYAAEGQAGWSIWRLPDPTADPLVVREGRRVTKLSLPAP